jgi:hypothetical protein
VVNNNITHVAIDPPANLDTDLVNKAAAIIGQNPLDTRRLLSGEIPKIIAHYVNIDSANMAVEKIRSLGIRLLTISDEDLNLPSDGFKVSTLEIANEQLCLYDAAGVRHAIIKNGVWLVIAGKREISVKSETTTTTTKFNLTGTLLSGGIPMWHRFKEKNISESFESTSFARLYENSTSGEWAELIRDQLNYASLGTAITHSSFTNFNRLLTQIRDFFPAAVFDDRLTKTSTIGTATQQPWQSENINCKLIYLFHQFDRNSNSR